MNIVHYSLGFPPYRSGGMIKYCMDLMQEEYNLGNNLFLLWPGKLIDLTSKIKIKEHSDFIYKKTRIHNIELINALPVPLLNGINCVENFIISKNVKEIKEFFINNNIEVFHIHTLMGLPRELIDVCKELSIKTIFTTHDYFGICSGWGLQKKGEPCINDHDCSDCPKCNVNALSFKKIKFLQSNIYRKIKNTPIIKLLRRKNNFNLFINETENNSFINDLMPTPEQYKKLRKYYVNMLENVSIMHFNSENTKKIYLKYVKNINEYKTINLVTNSIKDNRKYRKVNDIVRFGYLGSITRHKGYFLLKDACDELYNQNFKFELHIYSKTLEKKNYFKKHKPYRYNQLGKIMNQFDVLIVPSKLYETYGLTIPEALSYGIPVITTENVGAKDLIDLHNGIIVKEDFCSNLKKALQYFVENKYVIEEMNKYIVSAEFEDMKAHTKKILEIYK